MYQTIVVSLCLALAGLLSARSAQAIPEVQHWTTANGAQVYFVPAPELPMVDVQVVFDAGSARDGRQSGLASLTNALLDSGTAELSADAVAERFDSVGAQLNSDAARDMAWLSLRSLADARYLAPSVATLNRLLREPAFAQDALERQRNRMITAVRERAQSPAAIADLTYYQALYGDHPYATPPEGTEESLKTITREQIQACHGRYYVASNAVIAIVGALDRGGAEQLANALVEGLPEPPRRRCRRYRHWRQRKPSAFPIPPPRATSIAARSASAATISITTVCISAITCSEATAWFPAWPRKYGRNRGCRTVSAVFSRRCVRPVPSP